jgi:hypothetical protein
MYLNVLSFKNGKTLQFQSVTPYSVDKLKEPTPTDKYGDWNLVTDEANGQILSFRGSEVCTIATIKVEENRQQRRDPRKRKTVNPGKVPAIKTGITKE